MQERPCAAAPDAPTGKRGAGRKPPDGGPESARFAPPADRAGGPARGDTKALDTMNERSAPEHRIAGMGWAGPRRPDACAPPAPAFEATQTARRPAATEKPTERALPRPVWPMNRQVARMAWGPEFPFTRERPVPHQL